jgi:two-component system, OmpR family, phosphate regulon sensor histidine kinase PhoR
MQRKKFFWKLYPAFLLTCFGSIAVFAILGHISFKQFYYKETLIRLEEKANLIKDDVVQYLINDDISGLKEFVKKIHNLPNDRITIVLPKGRVIEDSGATVEDMELHNNRPEIIRALKGEVSNSIRESATLGFPFLYLAIPLRHENSIVGVLRHAVSVERLEDNVLNLFKKSTWLALLLILIISTILAWHGRNISGPLEEMKLHAERLSQGDFSIEINIDNNSPLEISTLARSLNKMSERIEKQWRKIGNQKSEQEAIFSSMHEGIITVDSKKNFFHANEYFCNMFKINKGELVKGMPLEQILRIPEIIEISQKVLEADGDGEYDSEITLNNKKILRVKASGLISAKGGKMGAVIVFTDISRLRGLEQMRKDFVANVSHELRTPLTSIQGFIETLLESEVEDKETQVKFFNIIKKQTIRLRNIVEELLTLSNLEKDKEIILIPEDVNVILKQAIFVCTQAADKKHIQLNFNIQEEVCILASASLLEQAFINLIDNAVKYSPEKSKIECKITKSDKSIVVAIRDEGPGVSKEHHGRLFERFYSIDKARSRDLGGSGLGLAIVKHVALLHKGVVSVQSSVGSGSTFSLSFPEIDS